MDGTEGIGTTLHASPSPPNFDAAPFDVRVAGLVDGASGDGDRPMRLARAAWMAVIGEDWSEAADLVALAVAGCRSPSYSATVRAVVDALVATLAMLADGDGPNHGALDRLAALVLGEARSITPVERARLDHLQHLEIANWFTFAGRFGDAARLIEHQLRFDADDVPALLWTLGVKAELDLRRGRWLQCRLVVDDAFAHSRRLGLTAGYLHVLAARLAFAGGQAEVGDQHLEAARSAAFDLGDASTLWRADAAEAFGALGRGEAAIAAGLLERLTARTRPAPVSVRLWDVDLVEALVVVGDRAGARRWTETMGTANAWDAAARARCRALVEDDPEAAFAQALGSVDGFDTLGAPFERARSELVAADLADRTGRTVDAGAHRSRAWATFTALGAQDWVGRALAGAGAGVGVGAGADGSAVDDAWAEVLTVQERAVALAIAAGTTNQGAAAQLYLSTKTVEMHLTRVYRKLGLQSRTQLALLVRGVS